ncbi:MAG: hypothetical protein KA257_09590 [Opitutaceae bacterium]|nr:hypothetical protein [Opitutaceae bacterium]
MLSHRRVAWWPVLAIVALGVLVGAVFYPVYRCRFIGLDDGNNIFLNPDMGGLSWERIKWAFGDLAYARRYMPFGWLGFSAVFSWQGLAPAGYHLASLAWHGLAAVALFGAVGRILRLKADLDEMGWVRWAAFLAALAWAVHPMRTEAVAWASGLLYTQASAFAFIALWLWTLRWTALKHTGWLALGSGLALAVSLLTYPIALGLPVVCWLLDRMAYERTAPKKPVRWLHGLSREVLGLGLVAALVLVVTLLARVTNQGNFATVAPLGGFGLGERSVQALYVWGRYWVQLCWPAQLSPIYTDLYALQPPEPSVLLTAGLSVVLVALAVGLAWRRRWSLVPVLAYSVMALPFLGLLEHPWIAQDRYAMLLHPVWLIAGAWGLLQLRSGKARVVVSGLGLAFVFLGAMQARALIGVWSDQESLETRLRETLPRNVAAGYYLGDVPASVAYLDGRFTDIEPLLKKTEAELPGWSAAAIRTEIAGLIRVHEDFMRQNWPGRALSPLVTLHYLHGKAAQAQEDWLTARAHFQAALRSNSAFGEAQREEAWCDLELLNLTAAEAAMKRAGELLASPAAGPRENEFWQLLASVYRSRGETERADEIIAWARSRLSGVPRA